MGLFRVRALQNIVYGSRRRKPSDIFDLKHPRDFDPKTMIKVSFMTESMVPTPQSENRGISLGEIQRNGRAQDTEPMDMPESSGEPIALSQIQRRS